MSLALVFVASLLGSPHCVAMCGGFVSLCSSGKTPLVRQSAYHLGRLITYILLGWITGMLGQRLNSIGNLAGIQNMAALMTGVILVASGSLGLLNLKSRKLVAIFSRPFQRLQKLILPDQSREYLFPLTLGIFSTFLPCGWLYTYVAVAAAQNSVFLSIATMMVFWLGTVPLLASVGSMSRFVLSPINKLVPNLASLILLIAGVFSLYAHFSAHHHHH